MSKLSLFIHFFGLLLGSTVPVRAQDAVSFPEKEIVIVDLFARNRIVPVVYTEAVRQQAVAAFVERGRQRIVDAAISRALAPPASDWGFVDPASAAVQQEEFMRNRTQTMVDAGARYVVTGAVSDYKFEHIDLPASGKNPPRPGFRSTFHVILSAYDLKLGKRIPDQIFVLRADAPVAEEADRRAISTLSGQLRFYVDNYFKFETAILQLRPADPRKGVQELYIHCGIDMGVRNGDLFLVYEEVPVGGVFMREKVGKLRVNSVQDTSVAKCKITKGSEEIVDAFLAGRPLICVSDGQALF